MLELKNISKRYRLKKVLDDVTLTLPDNGMIGIVGPSGCGKTTLLHIIGGIDNDFQGEIVCNGKRVKRHLHRYRRRHVSFIFQQLHLVMWMKAFDNCRLPHFFYKQVPIKNKKVYSKQSIASLSLGQRQRLAYWRCFYHRKDILLCDEPTGSLDPYHASEIYEKLYALSKNKLVVIVSHDLSLIEHYCHEVYEMNDGCIGEHRILKECKREFSEDFKEKYMKFPHIRLSFASLLSHKKQSIQLISGLVLSLLSILITLSLSRTLENEIQKYFYSLIPPSMISFKTNNHQNITIDTANKFMEREDIERVQLFLNDYELLGVGFKSDHYEESQTLMIGDDASPYQHLQIKKGRYPTFQDEIMISLSTAKHLAQSSSVDECIDKTLYAWYKHGLEVKSIAYHIVGITQNTTVVDTLYQQPNAYISLLKNVYSDEQLAHFGVMYVDVDFSREKSIQDLKTQYTNYDFMLSGEGTSKQISKVMNRVEIVLLIFSVLAILSSLFLIGEVMFLNVLQKKKDYAIMICFGAKMKDLIVLSICESLELLAAAWIVVVVLYYQFLMMCEMFVKELFVGNVVKLSFDVELIVFVFLFSVGLIFLSQLLPMIYTLRMNTIEALKQ